jgi:hypothetical protein
LILEVLAPKQGVQPPERARKVPTKTLTGLLVLEEAKAYEK